MKKLLWLALLLLLNALFVLAQAQSGRVIFIDPGHGGRDPGAIAKRVIDGKEIFLKESNITLEIGKVLKEKLLLAFPGIKVFITREDDVDISVIERMNRINSWELSANETGLYICLHNNYNSNVNLRGIRLFFGRNAESLRLAQAFSVGFTETYEDQMPFLGIFKGDFLDPTRDMPSVLVEIGNINNNEDVLLLYSSHALERCADALVKGIAVYNQNKGD